MVTGNTTYFFYLMGNKVFTYLLCLAYVESDYFLKNRKYVICSDCCGWFHLECANITNSQAETMDYICLYCAEKKTEVRYTLNIYCKSTIWSLIQ